MIGIKLNNSTAHGTLLLMIGQVIFMFAGYGVNILLALKLHEIEYAKFAIVMVILVWVELFVINGLPTAMQHFISRGKYNIDSIIQLGIKKQLIYCLLILGVFVCAVPICSLIFNDYSLRLLFWIASIDIFIYGMYWLYTGILGGQRRFACQAVSIIAYSIGKFGGVSIMIIAGYGVSGALIGNWIGSIVGLLTAIKFVGAKNPKDSKVLTFANIRDFAVPIVLFTITINLLLSVDIFFVKLILSDLDVAYYYNASTLARIPYIVFLALSFTLLPVLSRTIAFGTESDVQRQIRKVFRYMIIILIPLVFFFWQNSIPIIKMFYSSKFANAAPILPYLTLGLSIFTLFYIITTILNADNKPRLAFSLALITIVIDVITNYYLVKINGTIGAAQATTISSFVGLLIGGLFIYKRFKTLLPVVSVLRIFFVAIVTSIIFGFWVIEPVLVIPKAVIFSLIYFIGLLVIKEIEPGEIMDILVGRKGLRGKQSL